MLPMSEDLRGLDHGKRARLVEASLVVLRQLLHAAAPGEMTATNKEKLKSAMEKIRDTCTPGDKRRQLAEGILAQLR